MRLYSLASVCRDNWVETLTDAAAEAAKPGRMCGTTKVVP